MHHGLAAALVALLATAGCLSDRPGSSSLASMELDFHGREAVEPAVISVFQDDGYTLVERSPGELVFEREATQRDRVLFSFYGSGPMTMRVQVGLESRSRGGTLVRADVCAVQDGREEPISRLARRPYQAMLDRVKANLVAAK